MLEHPRYLGARSMKRENEECTHRGIRYASRNLQDACATGCASTLLDRVVIGTTRLQIGGTTAKFGPLQLTDAVPHFAKCGSTGFQNFRLR